MQKKTRGHIQHNFGNFPMIYFRIYDFYNSHLILATTFTKWSAHCIDFFLSNQIKCFDWTGCSYFRLLSPFPRLFGTWKYNIYISNCREFVFIQWLASVFESDILQLFSAILNYILDVLISLGGLDDYLRNIISLCKEFEIPKIFAMNRHALGKTLKKKAPVSVIGIFSYDGAQVGFGFAYL